MRKDINKIKSPFGWYGKWIGGGIRGGYVIFREKGGEVCRIWDEKRAIKVLRTGRREQDWLVDEVLKQKFPIKK
jgi:hypothetical protein